MAVPSYDAIVTEFEDDSDLAPGSGEERSAIERLGVDEELHQRVLEKLRARIKFSQKKMEGFYTRWNANEHRYQAYMRSEDLQELLKKSNERGTPPETTTITVPYSYATTMTIVTYLVHAFCGRNPMFSVGAYGGAQVNRAQKMETFLQFNADYVRLIRKYIQYFMDGEIYGLQVMRNHWKVKTGRRTKFANVSPNVLLLPGILPQEQRVQEEEIIFEGNEVQNIDVFRFFPDPRVPMEEVAERGEFVFWRTYEGRHLLKRAEQQGTISHLKKADTRVKDIAHHSERNRLADGDSTPGRDNDVRGPGSYQIDQGTVDLIPSEWGLADSDNVEKWIFSIANDCQIIQAEPLDADHDKHPVIVGEPYSTGYGFGNIAMLDLLGPMQDTLSWLINSHIYNVRAALNNQLLVNPQMVDMQDLKKPAPGRVIKLLPAAFGVDPKFAVSQLQVVDVTQGHVNDMAVIQRIADTIPAINDNLRGIQDAGGRKTATEVRTSGEAGASRLAAHARLVSSQSIVPHADMMTLNIQQHMERPFFYGATGEDPILPQDLQGHFYFPVHDGTLPMDRVGLMEIWKEILLAMFQQPVLGQRYDVDGIFQYVAELGGAKNISQFKLNVLPPDAAVPGNVIPFGGPGMNPGAA